MSTDIFQDSSDAIEKREAGLMLAKIMVPLTIATLLLAFAWFWWSKRSTKITRDDDIDVEAQENVETEKDTQDYRVSLLQRTTQQLVGLFTMHHAPKS